MSAWILRSRYPAVPVVVGMALALPSLWVGIQVDDWSVRSAVLGIPPVAGVSANPWQPFGFDGKAANYRKLMDAGWLPWWTDLECRTAHMRVLSILTHMLDFRAWDDHPVWMHIHSLLWYGALVFAAAVLYRRVIGQSPPLWAAGLAALLFAVDDPHAVPAGWLANRNSLLAGFFGIAALIAYDRRRRDGWFLGLLLAPAALAAALLSKEEAVCVLGYLVAYAVFVDHGSARRRVAALAPCAIVAAVWVVAYKVLGYGACHSGLYVDPTNDIARFARQVLLEAPIYLLSQWGWPSADVSNVLSAPAYRVLWWWALLYLSLVAVMVGPLVVRVRAARFWAAGMLLSVIPSCAIFASDRLLMFAGLGAAGLLAMWLGGVQENAGWVPCSARWRRVAGPCAYLFIGLHLIAAPLVFPVKAFSMRIVGATADRLFNTLPDDAGFAAQTAIFVNTGSQIADRTWLQSRRARGRPTPVRSVTLGAAGSALTVTRTDASTLVVRPVGGFLRPPRWVPPDERPAAIVSVRYLLQVLDLLVRSDRHPMTLGDTVELTAVTVTVSAMTQDGRPAEATYRFALPLEDSSYRWLQLTRPGYRPFAPPAIGETIKVAPPLDPWR